WIYPPRRVFCVGWPLLVTMLSYCWRYGFSPRPSLCLLMPARHSPAISFFIHSICSASALFSTVGFGPTAARPWVCAPGKLKSAPWMVGLPVGGKPASASLAAYYPGLAWGWDLSGAYSIKTANAGTITCQKPGWFFRKKSA
ncbi:RDD domain-containing protein, partial [Methylomonas fluvii]